MTHDRRDADQVPERASYAAPAVASVRTTRFFGIAKEGVDWGAVWGGLLTAIGLFVLLSVLATAVGITATRETAVDAGDAGRIGGVVSALLALLAFFAGGYVAGHMSDARDNASGALNGFLVWALALVLILILAGFGAGAAFGTLAQSFGPAIPGEVDPNAAAEGAQSAAWIAFISLALAATAATLGGWLGSETDDDAVVA